MPEQSPDHHPDGWPPVSRYREHLRLITGHGQYVADIPMADALVVSFVRSPIAHGRIAALDVSQARGSPGVVAVFTGADVAAIGALPVNPVLPIAAAPGFPILALATVQSVGQPIVAIIASSALAGADAADRVQIELDPATPTLTDHDGLPDPSDASDASDANRDASAAMARRWSHGDVDQAFAQAAHVVQATLNHPRLAPCPLESRSILAHYQPDDDALTIWLSTQTPHRSRDHLAAMLGISATRLRIIAPDVGGAFGMKASLYPEEVLVAWAALQLRRSVRWQASRSEEFLSAAQGRGSRTHGQLAVSADGRFLGLRARVSCPLGHWMTNSAGIPAWNASRILPGPYRCEAIDLQTEATLSHTAPVGIYRGAGRPEAAALMERLVDKAARATGLDALVIRRLNVLDEAQMPWQAPTGIIIDSARYASALAQLAREADYDRLTEQVRHRRAAGELVGIGCALYIEPCGQGWESARVQVQADGRIIAASGGSTQGQCRASVLARIVADVFDCDPQNVEVRIGDTATCPPGIGALASRSTAIGGSAMHQAAQDAHEQWRHAQSLTHAATDPITVDCVYEAHAEAWGYGCHLAVVAIDRETGQARCEQLFVVDDIGRVLDPTLAHDQIIGGIAQGLGEALLERVVYDSHGQLLTGSLLDYALPRASDMPAISISSLSTPTTANLLGAKGVGEAGTIGAPAAIGNAIHDALAEYTTIDLPMPFTPARIWPVIRNAQSREPSA